MIDIYFVELYGMEGVHKLMITLGRSRCALINVINEYSKNLNCRFKLLACVLLSIMPLLVQFEAFVFKLRDTH